MLQARPNGRPQHRLSLQAQRGLPEKGRGLLRRGRDIIEVYHVLRRERLS
jgi:hypothetical protein